MTAGKLTLQEKELARLIWDMTGDSRCSDIELSKTFQMAPKKVCDAIDDATQLSHYREGFCKNPFIR